MREGGKADENQEKARMTDSAEVKRTRSSVKEGDHWKNLEVWKIADLLAQDIYSKTTNFPSSEVFGLTSQLRRAALSIPTNIVEGCSRKGDRELAHYVNIALGSLGEVKYLIHFSLQVGYLNKEYYEDLSARLTLLGAKLWRFYETIRKTKA